MRKLITILVMMVVVVTTSSAFAASTGVLVVQNDTMQMLSVEVLVESGKFKHGKESVVARGAITLFRLDLDKQEKADELLWTIKIKERGVSGSRCSSTIKELKGVFSIMQLGDCVRYEEVGSGKMKLTIIE